MPIPVRKTLPTDRDDLLVQVTDDGSKTLVVRGTDDAYHSGCGALSESRHVFLNNSGVAERLQNRLPTRVLEVGLGTAMNLLLSMEQAILHDAQLDYVALECDWLSAETLQFLEPHRWVANRPLVDSYLQFRSQTNQHVEAGTFRWQFDSERSVRIEVGDALQWAVPKSETFDAIFFDAFCPATAPDFWESDYFDRLRIGAADHARLVTYSCSRTVRQNLEQAGWSVKRVAGPVGGKREVLIAAVPGGGIGRD